MDTNSNSNTIMAIVVVVIVLVVGGILLLNSKGDESIIPPVVNVNTTGNSTTTAPSSTTGSTSPTTVTASTTVSVGTVKEFTVKGTNYAFAPSTLSVKKGDTVKITFVNAGGFHDLKIDEFNVATKQIQDGKSDTVQFVAGKTGTFEYYCTVGTHRAMGMKGTLTVTE